MVYNLELKLAAIFDAICITEIVGNKSAQNKIFKVCRIGWIKPTCYLWEHEEKHEVISPDCFRMNGKESIPVTLKMTLMAKNLLIEEYPLSASDLTYEDGYWWLRTNVKSRAGVGRFYLGLSDQIEIHDSPELISYISEHVRRNLTIFFDN